MAHVELSTSPPPSKSVTHKSTFAGNVLRLASGTALAQVLSVLASPLMVRLFAPETFGLFAVFTSLTSILAVLACLRYELAIMLPERDEEAVNLLGVSLGFSLLLSLLMVPVIFWGQEYLLRWLNAPRLAPYLWLVPPMVFVSGVFLALNYWNSRTKHFGRLSIARVSNSVATIITQLSFGLAGFATAGTMIGASVGGKLLATAVLGGQIWQDDRKIFLQAINWREMVRGVKRYRKFPLIDIWGALFNTVSWQLPVFLLALFFSQAAVGFYAFGFRLINLPMSLIGAALSQVYFQKDQSRLAETTLKVFQRLVALCLLPTLLLSVVGREAFSLIFGPDWAEAGVYTQILSIWMFFWFISSPLSTIFIILERQELFLIVQFAILASRAISLYIGGMLGDVYLSLGLFSISGVLIYGGLTFWNLSMANVRLKDSFLISFRYLLYALPVIAPVFLLKMLNVSHVLLISTASVGFAIYYALLIRGDPNLIRVKS
jgi:lipopolysaccharide exporter